MSIQINCRQFSFCSRFLVWTIPLLMSELYLSTGYNPYESRDNLSTDSPFQPTSTKPSVIPYLRHIEIRHVRSSSTPLGLLCRHLTLLSRVRVTGIMLRRFPFGQAFQPSMWKTPQSHSVPIGRNHISPP